jgi:hypothetical protein
MYARVATWEGGEADAIRTSAEQSASRAAAGPPEGVPATGFMLLVDPENGRTLAITPFDTEEALRKGDETLNAMTPDVDNMGKRTTVEKYEVAVDVKA